MRPQGPNKKPRVGLSLLNSQLLDDFQTTLKPRFLIADPEITNLTRTPDLLFQKYTERLGQLQGVLSHYVKPKPAKEAK